ncbi:hypothetical protein OUZ56_013644 [Daphnia magna]|uniref:Uncharacterized protein n=1 Tax=Daphnia magna TaxID=35525 RepID=A0ABQ9Z6J0_9CRUS|nr:hypothetical protein OUZ56_013644 [Daphnia magna]
MPNGCLKLWNDLPITNKTRDEVWSCLQLENSEGMGLKCIRRMWRLGNYYECLGRQCLSSNELLVLT